MKTGFTKIFTGVMLLGLVGCNGGSSDKKAADIPVAPERIYSLNFNGQQDNSSYCDISGAAGGQRSFTCTSTQSVGSLACTSPVIQFTDATLCGAVSQILNQGGFQQGGYPGGYQQGGYQQGGFQQQQCGLQALQALYQRKCLNVNNGNPNQNGIPVVTQPISNLPAQPLDPNFKSIQCEFEALRQVQGRWVQRNYNTGRLTTSVIIDSRIRQDIDLRSKFLGFDIGSFGNTKMTFSPAGLRGSADSITVSNSGLNSTTSASQSGFAGQEVRLDVQNDEGNLRLMVSCKGVSQFKKNLSTKTYSKLSCKGESNLGSRREKIDLSLPYNSSLLENEITLAENLVLNVSGDTAGQDNARISITATGVDSDLTMQTSAYLKTAANLKINDGYSNVDVTCTPLQ